MVLMPSFLHGQILAAAQLNLAFSLTEQACDASLNGVVHDPFGALVAANTAAFQALLNNPVNTNVILPAGVTVYTTGLTIQNPGSLTILGTLILAPTISGQSINPVVSINSSHVTVVIGATGVIDGNRANQAGTSVGAAGISTVQNIAIAPALPWTDVYIYGPGIVQNCVNWPVTMNSVNRTRVIGLTMLNCGNAFQVSQGTTNFEIAGNTVSGNADYGFAAYQGCSWGIVHHNIFVNVATVGVLNDGSASTGYNMLPCHNILFDDNLIDETLTWGYSVHNASYAGAAANHYDIEFRNSEIYNAANDNTANPSGLYADNCDRVSFKGILISGGGTASANNFAINAGIATATNLVFDDITVENLGQVGVGFGLVVGAPGLTATNIRIRDTQTTPTMQYGVYGTCGAGTLLRVRAQNMIGANYDFTPLADTIISYPVVPGPVTLPASPLVNGTIYHWPGPGVLEINIQVQFNPTGGAAANGNLFVSSTSTFSAPAVLADQVIIPAGGVAGGYQMLKASVPPNFYYGLSGIANVTIGTGSTAYTLGQAA